MVSPQNRSNNKIEKKLLRTVRNTIARFGMFVPGDAVLIAVSGGPDSVTLAHVLHILAGEYSLRLAIAHLNHCLRNQESDRDAEFVTTFARRLDLPFYLERKDVRSFQRQYHLSPEEAARQVRYAFYEAVASQDGFNKIALGHHCDDNAELVLMNLLRGSGPLGLSGIAPVRNDKIVRPLIHLKRSEILDYASEKKIAYVTDTSNTDPAFRRNKIRHHLIPELKKSYNPAIVDTLNRLGAILRAEDNWFEEALGPVFKNCVLNRTSDTISLSAPEFNNLTRAAKRRIIRKAIFSVKQDLRRITLFHVDAVLELAKKDPASGSLNLPGGIRVVKKAEVELVAIAPRIALFQFRAFVGHVASRQVVLDEAGNGAVLDKGGQDLDRQSQVRRYAGHVRLSAGGLHEEGVTRMHGLAVGGSEADAHAGGNEQGIITIGA